MITTTQTHVCLILILGLGIFGCARTTARVSLDPIDAETPRNLTRHRAEDRTPTWSTLGQMLLFESDRAGNRDIWSMVPDGSSALAMTDNAGDDMYPAWSPGGGRFVFQSARGGVAGLWVMEIGTQRVTLLLEDDSSELYTRLVAGSAVDRLHVGALRQPRPLGGRGSAAGVEHRLRAAAATAHR